jgi:hypothetical protein
LQLTERGPPGLVQHHDLAVENGLPATERFWDRGDEFGEVGGEVVAVPTPHIRFCRIGFDDRTGPSHLNSNAHSAPEGGSPRVASMGSGTGGICSECPNQVVC